MGLYQQVSRQATGTQEAEGEERMALKIILVFVATVSIVGGLYCYIITDNDAVALGVGGLLVLILSLVWDCWPQEEDDSQQGEDDGQP